MTGARLTKLVVGGIIGSAVLWLIYALTGPVYGSVLAAILLYEAYTLINAYEADTISETVWLLSAWQLVPFLFGAGMGGALGGGLIADAALAAAVMFLMSHFFGLRNFAPFFFGVVSGYALTPYPSPLTPDLLWASGLGYVMAVLWWQPRGATAEP